MRPDFRFTMSGGGSHGQTLFFRSEGQGSAAYRGRPQLCDRARPACAGGVCGRQVRRLGCRRDARPDRARRRGSGIVRRGWPGRGPASPRGRWRVGWRRPADIGRISRLPNAAGFSCKRRGRPAPADAMASGPGAATGSPCASPGCAPGPAQAGAHRRDEQRHEDAPPARRQAAGRGIFRAPENPDLHRSSALRRPDRAPRAPRAIDGAMSRGPSMPGPKRNPHRPYGQARRSFRTAPRPTKARRPKPQCERAVPLSATGPARPEPHGNGVSQAKGPSARDRCRNRRRSGKAVRQSCDRFHPEDCLNSFKAKGDQDQ